MSKMEKAFAMFEEGILDVCKVSQALGIKKVTVSQYKYTWKKNKGQMTPDDLADALFGEGKIATTGVESQPFEENDVVGDESHQENEKACDGENNQNVEVVGKMIEEVIQELGVAKNTEAEVGIKKVLPIPGVPTKRLKITRTVSMVGNFGTYEATNQVVDVMLETGDMSLSKENLIDFIAELQEVVGNI